MGKTKNIESLINDIKKLESTEKDIRLRQRFLNAESELASILKIKQEQMLDEDSPKKKKFKCIQCGECCRKAYDVWQGTVNISDIAFWIANRRYDILAWVNPLVVQTTQELIFDIWINPKTGNEVERCPWLRKKRGINKYYCTIHDVKPSACRDFPFSTSHAKEMGCKGYR